MDPKSTKEILRNLAIECMVRQDTLVQARQQASTPAEYERYRLREGNLLDLGVVFTRAADKMEE